MRGSTPCIAPSSLSQNHSPKVGTIRFALGLGRTATVVALILLAAPAFAVTTNVSVAGVPPDQVQSVTLTVLGGTPVQAERRDEDRTGTVVWVVDTPEAIAAGTLVDVAVRLANGQTAVFFTNMGPGGTIAVDAEKFYTASTSQSASAAETFTVHTTPGNIIKFVPNFTYAFYRQAIKDFAWWGIRPETAPGQASNAGPNSAGNSQRAFGATDSWRVGAPFDSSGFRFRYRLNPDYTFGDSGMTYEQQVEDALRAITPPSVSGSVAQDSSHSCHYGSGEGHPLGHLGRMFGSFSGWDLPLRLEVNTSEDGQDDQAWTSLGDYLNTPGFDLGGAPFTGGTDPLRERLNRLLLYRFEEALQEGHDQDPVQGVADENGTFSAEFYYDFGAMGSVRWIDVTDTGDTESINLRMQGGGRGFSGGTDFLDGQAGLWQIFPDAATAGRAASGDFILDPDDWLTWSYPSSWSPQIANLLEQAGIEATPNSCRDKAPGPFLDWGDPNVESKYRSSESGPDAFVLRLP